MDGTVNKRRWGDRKEGRLLRSFPAYNKFEPFIMKTRADATNYFADAIEVTEVDRWVREKRKDGYPGIGIMHLFLAAYVRTVAYRPGINRFIAGQRVYARNNIEVLMTVKHALSDESEESTVKVKFSPSDTVFDIYRKINQEIDEIKSNQGGNGADKFAENCANLPRILLNLTCTFLRMFDYFGWLPQALLDFSPFHGSMIMTDLGSIGIPPVYHHIYNFGNLPLFLAFGAKRHVIELDKTGSPVDRKYIDFKISSDERICDGFYLASSFKYLKHFLRNPRLLELPPEKVEQDIF